MTTPAARTDTGYRHTIWQQQMANPRQGFTDAADAMGIIDTIWDLAGVANTAKKRAALAKVRAAFTAVAAANQDVVTTVDKLYADTITTLTRHGGDQEMGSETDHHQ